MSLKDDLNKIDKIPVGKMSEEKQEVKLKWIGISNEARIQYEADSLVVEQLQAKHQEETEAHQKQVDMCINDLKAQLKAKDKLISSKDSWLQSFNQDFIEKDKIISKLKQEHQKQIKKIYDWGMEKCPHGWVHLDYPEGTAVVVADNKHNCPTCWSELLNEE
jgi:hypothetical protein